MDTQPRSRRPYGSLVPHVFALAVFGMVAYSGVWSVATEAGRLAVPWLMAGVGGTLGALGLLIIAYLRRDNADAQVSDRVTRAVRSLRIFMAVVAVTGVMLAPTGMGRGFAIAVNIGLAVALASFAAWAPDADAVHTTARPRRRA